MKQGDGGTGGNPGEFEVTGQRDARWCFDRSG
jgi:hypothetical protein